VTQLDDPACTSVRCITCGDALDPMTVIAVDDDRGIALCEGDDGARASVEVALVAPVHPGDVLLVHAGTAISHDAAAIR
jgi:hydrogenase maturation factor